ncbi:MAG: DinB family protein [Chloroflexi bacterium]|nr:MAG: DinB family protein [Chloroflexota bacterium]
MPTRARPRPASTFAPASFRCTLAFVDREAALSDFDAAREEWEAAFAQVPDSALAYLKPGDDYAIGGLQVHVNWVLVHYGRILDGIRAEPQQELQPLDKPGESDEANKRARAGLTAAERKPALEEMSGLHRFVKDTAADLSEADWSRKTPVIYGDGQDPYPTSPDDVLGWLRDHYREHVEQCPELVASWREMS